MTRPLSSPVDDLLGLGVAEGEGVALVVAGAGEAVACGGFESSPPHAVRPNNSVPAATAPRILRCTSTPVLVRCELVHPPNSALPTEDQQNGSIVLLW